jgi:hypothetical protein
MGTTGHIQSPRVWATGSIASGAAISAAIDLMGYRPAAIDISSGWNASNAMTFQGSQNASVYYGLYDDVGLEYMISSAAMGSATGRAIVPNADLSLALAAHRYLKVQSGPTSSPVNQTTAISFSIVLVPF